MRAPDFWSSDSAQAKTCATLLSPLGAAYALSVRLRRAGARPYRARARVICIGNLTVGGSGKTPVAMAVAEMAARHGKVAFLSRGYGGRLNGPVVVDPNRHTAKDVGDEPLLLAQRGTAIIARNRAEGARLADKLGAGFIVMDDGFQNFSVTKDLSLLVVDAETGFGNGKIVPAGPLREPVHSGCARADAIILVGNGSPNLPRIDVPVFRAKLIPKSYPPLQDERVIAFAGIARPEKFFRTLSAQGANLIGTITFDDHHVFTESELWQLKNQARAAGAVLMTTEKDFIRIPGPARVGIQPVAIRTAFDVETGISRLLSRLVSAREPALHGA
jgi:tetraacyldisaccharide 4'-kinase